MASILMASIAVASIAMAYIGMAYLAMASIVMASIVMALYSYDVFDCHTEERLDLLGLGTMSTHMYMYICT